MDNLNQIKTIARSVRKWAEKTYGNSNYFTKSLSGLCAICSYRLFLKLKEKGISSEFVNNYWSQHCFVLVDNYIVDVTATQFCYEKKMPKVLVKRLDKVNDREIWSIGDRARDPNHIRKILKQWPKEQQPCFSVE